MDLLDDLGPWTGTLVRYELEAILHFVIPGLHILIYQPAVCPDGDLNSVPWLWEGGKRVYFGLHCRGA